MASGTKRALSEALDVACGNVEGEKEERRRRRDFLNALDERGFVLMPREAADELLNAALAVMRAHERAIPDGWGKQRVKQVLRYTAMVERQRLNLLPLSGLPDETCSGASDQRALARAVERAAGRVLPGLNSTALRIAGGGAETSPTETATNITT